MTDRQLDAGENIIAPPFHVGDKYFDKVLTSFFNKKSLLFKYLCRHCFIYSSTFHGNGPFESAMLQVESFKAFKQFAYMFCKVSRHIKLAI